MSGRTLGLVMLAQVGLVAGQLFLKHGMNKVDLVPRPVRAVAGNIAAGVGMLTLWFLVWMGLLQRHDLSFVYPFEGISPALLALAACAVLREKLSARGWAGVALIAAGAVMVGRS